MTEMELAVRLGFRIIRFSSGYQIQRVDARGAVTSVGPAQKYAHDLWLMCVELAQTAGEEVIVAGAPQQA